MREQFWNFYVSLVHKSYYYKYFQILFDRINWIISGFCTILSLSSVAAWGIWNSFPILWSVLICFSQIIQVFFPKNPYNDLLISSRFMVPELTKLLHSVRFSWLSFDVRESSDDEILQLLKEYEATYDSLVSQFFSSTYLPEIDWIEKHATEECINYFSTTYPQKGGD